MSPINEISSVIRIPRLGKIHLGIKVSPPNKNPYPKATDYFVCPPEVQKIYGEQPRELDIMFPTEDQNQFAQQWLRRYSRTNGLTCIGNGLTCSRKTDTKTRAMVTRDSRAWIWKDELTCNPQDCLEYTKKYCRRIMNLQFLLPECGGLGVWQVDTTSFYSIVNINSMVEMLKAMIGRCSMLPLKLVLGPIEVTPPGENKKTVYVMHISTDVKLANLAKLAQLPTARALLPEPETEEPPADLYPDGVMGDETERGGAPFDEETEQGVGLFDDEPTPTVDREALRKEIAQLLLGPRPTDRQISMWWTKQPWGYTLIPQDFDSNQPFSEEVKAEHLELFKEDLEAFKKRATPKTEK